MDKIKELRSHALKAFELAYCPYSHFQVGCSILMENGSIYSGSNIENASYGATVCAERVAIFKAISELKQKIKKLYIYTKDGVPPCGMCRQVMTEFADESLEIIMGNSKGEEKIKTLGEIFKDGFYPSFLGK